MKKLVLVLLVLAAIGAMAFAEPAYDRGDDEGSYEDNTTTSSTPKDSESEPQSSSKGGGGFVAWPPSIADDMVLINFGIGLGYSSWGYTIGLPPIKLSVDFELPIPVPISVGGMVGLRTWTYKWGWFYSYLDDFTIFEIPIGIRSMYHFNFAALTDSAFVRKLDVYAGLTLGWVIVTDNYSGNSRYWTSRDSFFLFGVTMGARYFFNDVIGIYLEAGYSGFEYASFGLSLKF
jgi:hypothetical protein